jgi:hypothetical protein
MRVTTLLLEEDEDGWRATQRTVDLVGRGPDPARAATHYCALVAATEYDTKTEGSTLPAEL